MTQALENLQNVADRLSPAVLISLGFVSGWLGLCVWLGGLRWLKAVSAAVLACAGFAAAWFLSRRGPATLIGFSVVPAAAGMFFEKLTAVLLAAAITTALILSVLAWPAISDTRSWQDQPVTAANSEPEQPIGPAQSLSVLAEQAAFFWSVYIRAVSGLGAALWVAGAIVVLTTAGLGLVWPDGVCAYACSMLGTAGIFAGMFFLLAFKGSKPVSYLLAWPGGFALIASAMAVFGTLAGLAICSTGRPDDKKKPSSKGD